MVEVASGDCIVVADDAAPYGSAQAERRVFLSSIRAPKVGNPKRNEKPASFAREAKEFLRTRLIGQQVKSQDLYVDVMGQLPSQSSRIGRTQLHRESFPVCR